MHVCVSSLARRRLWPRAEAAAPRVAESVRSPEGSSGSCRHGGPRTAPGTQDEWAAPEETSAAIGVLHPGPSLSRSLKSLTEEGGRGSVVLKSACE